MVNIKVDTPRSRRRNMLKGGAIAGVVGGIVIALVMMLVAMVQGTNLWIGMKVAAYPFLGERVMAPGFDAGPVLLGVASHFAVSIIWGLLFALLVFGLSRPATVWLGAFWGIVVWLGMFYVVLPMVGAGVVARGAPVGTAVLEHLTFGVALGMAFLPYQRPQPGRRPWWRTRQARAA